MNAMAAVIPCAEIERARGRLGRWPHRAGDRSSRIMLSKCTISARSWRRDGPQAKNRLREISWPAPDRKLGRASMAGAVAE